MLLRFDAFVLDVPARQLLRDGRTVPLSPKAFDLLATLAAERPRVFTREELLRALWPGTFVGRASVARLVNEVRQALGDDARQPRYVRTAHRRGYAFVAEAPAPPAAATPGRGCRLVWGTAEIALREGDNLIGRAAEAVVRIPSAKVSRRHARIVVGPGGAELEDLRSRNGTCLRGRRIDGRTPLASGDEITVGPALLVFVCDADASATTRTD